MRLHTNIVKNCLNTKRIKILYIITQSELGGAQSHIYDLISSLRLIYEIHLVTGSSGPLTRDLERLGIRFTIISQLVRDFSPVNDFLSLVHFSRVVSLYQPHLIHAHSSKAGFISRLVGWRDDIPTIFTAHGWSFSYGIPWTRRWIGLSVEFIISFITSHLICVSDSDINLAMSYGVAKSSKLTKVPYGIPQYDEANSEKRINKINDSIIRIIMVARFNEQKDQCTLIRAIHKLNNPMIHVSFVGSGIFLEKCQRLSIFLGIQNSIDFLGDRRDIPDLLSKSDIFILSTHYEGLPISIIEAMREGLPVIASNVNGICEEVEDGVTGYLVPPKDVNSMSCAISTLASDHQLRENMGLAGQQKFKQTFTLDRMISEIQNVYNKVLEVSSFK